MHRCKHLNCLITDHQEVVINRHIVQGVPRKTTGDEADGARVYSIECHDCELKIVRRKFKRLSAVFRRYIEASVAADDAFWLSESLEA